MKKTLITSSVVLSTVFAVFAQTANTANLTPIKSLLKQVSEILGMLSPIAVGLALLAFFWYLIIFIWKGKDDGEQKKAGLAGMGYSILALFVMIAIWGILALVANIIGVNVNTPGVVPVVPVIQQQ